MKIGSSPCGCALRNRPSRSRIRTSHHSSRTLVRKRRWALSDSASYGWQATRLPLFAQRAQGSVIATQPSLMNCAMSSSSRDPCAPYSSSLSRRLSVTLLHARIGKCGRSPRLSGMPPSASSLHEFRTRDVSGHVSAMLERGLAGDSVEAQARSTACASSTR
jgi:hypothetical protein